MANRFTLVTLVFLIKSHNFEFQVYVAVELSNNSCTCKNYMHEDSSYSVGLLRDKQSCCICVHWHQRPEGYTLNYASGPYYVCVLVFLCPTRHVIVIKTGFFAVLNLMGEVLFPTPSLSASLSVSHPLLSPAQSIGSNLSPPCIRGLSAGGRR